MSTEAIVARDPGNVVVRVITSLTRDPDEIARGLARSARQLDEARTPKERALAHDWDPELFAKAETAVAA